MMTQHDAHEPTPQVDWTPPTEASPLTLPPARLREPSADDLEMDISDRTLDLPLDDSDRLREDAETLRD